MHSASVSISTDVFFELQGVGSIYITFGTLITYSFVLYINVQVSKMVGTTSQVQLWVCMYTYQPSLLTCVHNPKHKYEYDVDPLTGSYLHPKRKYGIHMIPP